MITSGHSKRPAAARCADLYFSGEQSPAMVALLKKPWTFTIQIMPEYGCVTAIFSLHEEEKGRLLSSIGASLWVATDRGAENALSIRWTVESGRDGSDSFGLKHEGYASTVDAAHGTIMALMKHLRTLPAPSFQELQHLRDVRRETVRTGREAKALERGPRSYWWEWYVSDFGHEPGTPRPAAVE